MTTSPRPALRLLLLLAVTLINLRPLTQWLDVASTSTAPRAHRFLW